MTAAQVYENVLSELKREYTSTMTPEEFNTHIHIAQLEWVKVCYTLIDQQQKSNADISAIRVVTDGIGGMPNALPNIGQPIAGRERFVLPSDFLYLLAVAAQVKYYNVPCTKDGTLSPWINAKPLPSDRAYLFNDYYTRPMAVPDRLYYTQLGSGQGELRFAAGDSIVQFAQLHYLRYPRRILVDDNGDSVQNPEFGEVQCIEIAKWCVASYLEKLEEMRAQSYIQLGQLRNDQLPPLSPNSTT
jgi:hypothetical protein